MLTLLLLLPGWVRDPIDSHELPMLGWSGMKFGVGSLSDASVRSASDKPSRMVGSIAMIAINSNYSDQIDR
uniref:Putative secreted peptide n=1 Tax=Anopheles braziliensis TaxID=58242 RepID=A0A2M3ZVE9_9DIPT